MDVIKIEWAKMPEHTLIRIRDAYIEKYGNDFRAFSTWLTKDIIKVAVGWKEAILNSIHDKTFSFKNSTLASFVDILYWK